MADNPTPPWWGEQWMEANRRSWDAWAGAFRGPADAAAPRAASGPTAGLDWWWRLMRAPGPAFASVPDPLDRLIEQGKMFLRFGEEFTAGVLAGNGVQNADAWAQAFKTFTDNWQAAFAQPQADPAVAQLWKSASAPWGEMAAGLQAQAERLLGLPGLGYTRESQEQWQEMARLTLAYQEAFHDYAAAFRPLAPDALNRLQRRLADCAERSEPVNTLRGLYDLWVDASEEAYLALVSTDAYSRVHGRMTNAFMALKHQARHMMDDAVGSMGLPTRAGVDTLQRRQQELRREVVSLRAGAADAAALRNELAELRREVQTIRSQQSQPPTVAPPPRRTAKTIRRKSEET